MRSLILASLALAIPCWALAQGRPGAGVCDLVARDAAAMVSARDSGRPLGDVLAEIAASERRIAELRRRHYGEQPSGRQSRAAWVASTMARDIYANPGITADLAIRLSYSAPCGWPGASARDPVPPR